jgi:hypothetical protein
MTMIEHTNPQYDARAFRAKLRSAQRVAGIKGVATLDFRLDATGEVSARRTATGKQTQSVDLAHVGLQPSAQVTMAMDRPGSFDMSKTQRYALHYSGAQFAKSADREARKREREAFFAWFPYWPRREDTGKPQRGTPLTINGIAERVFTLANGHEMMLSELREDHESRERGYASREAEIKALEAEQADDMASDRKHSRRV